MDWEPGNTIHLSMPRSGYKSSSLVPVAACSFPCAAGRRGGPDGLDFKASALSVAMSTVSSPLLTIFRPLGQTRGQTPDLAAQSRRKEVEIY